MFLILTKRMTDLIHDCRLLQFPGNCRMYVTEGSDTSRLSIIPSICYFLTSSYHREHPAAKATQHCYQLVDFNTCVKLTIKATLVSWLWFMIYPVSNTYHSYQALLSHTTLWYMVIRFYIAPLLLHQPLDPFRALNMAHTCKEWDIIRTWYVDCIPYNYYNYL